MVILFHAGWERMPGDLGVSTFFVLSGFLITWLLIKEKERTGGISLPKFYQRRAFRLLPAYYAYLAIALPNYLFRHGGRTDVVLPAFLYYANYFNATHGHPVSPISHIWSLAVEEQFYVFWPLIFAFLSGRGRRTLVSFLALSIVIVVAWRSYLFLVARVGTPYVYNAFDTRFDNLAVGCLAALLTESERFLQGVRRLSSHWSFPAFTIGLIAASRLGLPDDYHYSVGFTIDASLTALAMLQIMTLSSQAPWRWLDWRAARFVGSVSYPMYLYGGYATIAAHRVVGEGHFLALMVASLLVAVLFGAASYYIVERPFLRLRGRLTERRPASAVTLG